MSEKVNNALLHHQPQLVRAVLKKFNLTFHSLDGIVLLELGGVPQAESVEDFLKAWDQFEKTSFNSDAVIVNWKRVSLLGSTHVKELLVCMKVLFNFNRLVKFVGLNHELYQLARLYLEPKPDNCLTVQSAYNEIRRIIPKKVTAVTSPEPTRKIALSEGNVLG